MGEQNDTSKIALSRVHQFSLLMIQSLLYSQDSISIKYKSILTSTTHKYTSTTHFKYINIKDKQFMPCGLSNELGKLEDRITIPP